MKSLASPRSGHCKLKKETDHPEKAPILWGMNGKCRHRQFAWLLVMFLGLLHMVAMANQTISLATGMNYVTCQIWPSGGTQGDINNPGFLQASASMSDVNGVGNAKLYYWNCAGFQTYSYFTGADADAYFANSGSPNGWYDGGGALANNIHWTQGKGMIVEIVSGFGGTLDLLGTSPAPLLPPTNMCPCGQLSLLGRQGTDAGTFENITGYASSEGAQVFRWNGSGYVQYDYTLGAWTPATPTLNVGEAAFFRVPCPTSTNCCGTCTNANICITNIIQPGIDTYLANNLCMGTNTTLSELFPNPPPGTTVKLYNCGYTAYVFDEFDLVWTPNDPTLTPGMGFIINIPTWAGPYTWIRCGCIPNCPPPCLPNTNCCVLVGKRGPGTGTWDDLSSCPPVCGTEVQLWNGTGFTTHTYTLSGWSPSAPVLPEGYSAWVCKNANINCDPCTNNLVVNGSFENPFTGTVGQWPSILGWTATDGASNPTTIELWGANYGAMAAQDGNQHLEINGNDYNVTVSQVITNLSTNCPARFCFWYTGRPGYANNTFVAEVIGSGVSPVTNNPAVYTNSNSWIQYCVDFVPTSPTLTIRFTGASGLPMAGAHIDNVSLMQCCTNPPCNEPLVVNCATNKTVDCSAAWQFDPPTAESPCCGTNITITVNATWTNGVCPKLVSRIWQITDCLNHTATCTQTVTVVDSTAPVFGTDCVTNVYSAGGSTSFVTPSPSFPRPALMTRLQQLWGVTSTRGFDECAVNKWFAHSFTNLPKCITAAYLEIRLKPCGDICGNDAMHFWFAGSGNNNAVFSQYFGGGNVRAGLATNDWCSYAANPQTFILDLSALPASGAGAANILPLLEANGFLDVTTQDDTGVDYVKLTVVSCCGIASKTVECGSLWFFDTPLAADNCCPNPTVTVLSTITNGFCPKTITRTWRAVDCCGNAATNSQTVTVVDTTPPVVNCPSGYTRYTCDSSMVVKYNVKATDACSGTLPVTCNPPSGYNFPVGTTIVTCTATDACGNVGTCTFPVTIINQSVSTSVMLGQADCFKKPKENAPKSAQLKAAHPGANWKRFDVKKVNRPFGLSFMNLPKNLTCATLEIRMKPNCKDISSNDSISIGLNTNLTAAWTSYIGSGNPSPGLTPSVWCDVGECGQVFTFDLANMPNGGANLLPVINALGQVDIYIQDDTAVDYAKLTYCYCKTRPWWRGWDWDVSNAEIYHGDVFTLVKPVVPGSNYTATISPGATHGVLVGVAPLNLGSVSNASLTATAQVTGDPANGASAVKLTGDGNGKVGLALPSLSPGVTQVKLVYSLNGAVVGQSILPPTSGTNAIIIMEDGPMIRAISVTDDRALDAQDDRITVSLAGPSNTRECPMCPPTLADQITVMLVNPARTPDDLFTSLSLTAEGLDEFELGETAMLAGDGWVSIRGDGEASIGDDQLTVTRQDAATTTNRMGLTIHLPVTNAVSFNLSAFLNAVATGFIDVELFGIGSSGQDGVEVFNIGSSGQDGVDFFNIGSSGQDGVRVYNIGSSGQDGVDFWNLGSSGQDGVSIAARFTETNGGWNLQADFSKLGSNLELYRVYNHGVLVTSLSHHGNPHIPILPGTLHVKDSDSTPSWIIEWASDEIAIRINGTDYVGNELRVSPVTLDQPLGRLVVANIGSSGQDGVSIAAVTTPESVRRMLPLEDEDEELSIEWTGPAGGAIESAPALTGPWTLVPNQGGHAATAPSPQSTNAPSAQFFRVKAN